MIGRLVKARPWHQPVRRVAGYLHRRTVLEDARAEFFFEGLGANHVVAPRGRALVSYTPDLVRYMQRHPDVGPRGWDPAALVDKLPRIATELSHHQMYWQSAEMVRQLIERGYIVDYVCDRHGDLVPDVSHYDVIVDEWTNLPRWGDANPHARTLFYATASHWLFHNRSELTRHAWLFARRGVELSSNRQLPHLTGDAVADLVTSCGNAAVRATYGPHEGKIRRLCTTAVNTAVPPIARDWDVARRTFLFFASDPWLHKGLDLVVEAFLQEPELTLHVVTRGVSKASDFERIYGADIEAAPNIHMHGSIDVLDPRFDALARECGAFVFPSAAEGCAGSAVQCLHYGMIPLLTAVVGPEIHDFWPALEGETDGALIEEIRRRCNEVAAMSRAELEAWSHRFLTYAQAFHVRTLFSQRWSELLDQLLPG